MGNKNEVTSASAAGSGLNQCANANVALYGTTNAVQGRPLCSLLIRDKWPLQWTMRVMEILFQIFSGSDARRPVASDQPEQIQYITDWDSHRSAWTATATEHLSRLTDSHIRCRRLLWIYICMAHIYGQL